MAESEDLEVESGTRARHPSERRQKGDQHGHHRVGSLSLLADSVPDWVIRAQFGHVSPAMMAVYSHVRRKALDEAAKALEPEAAATTHRPTSDPSAAVRQLATNDDRRDWGVMSHVTSQHVSSRHKVIEFPKKSGSSGWTRTSNPPVNSLTQVFGLVGSSCR